MPAAAFVLCRMREIHRLDLIHRDLKSENIFIKRGNQLVIGDFGATREVFRRIVRSTFSGAQDFLDPTVKMNPTTRTLFYSQGLDVVDGGREHVGSLGWMAPEIIDAASPADYTKASDVYAFAVVLCELATRRLPWSVELAKWRSGEPFLTVEGVEGILPTDVPSDDQEFVKMSVKAGRRPSLPRNSAPSQFRKIIEKCWAAKSDARPLFFNEREADTISQQIRVAWEKIQAQHTITLVVSVGNGTITTRLALM